MSKESPTIQELESVLLLDFQEINKPTTIEIKKWREVRVPHIVKLEEMSKGNDIAPILIEAPFDTFRAYRFGVGGYDEPIYVKSPIPKVFMRLIDGILSAHVRRIKALEDEIKRLREEFHRQRMSVPEPYRDPLYSTFNLWIDGGGTDL